MAQTKPKSNSVVTSTWDLAAGTIKFVVVGAGAFVFDAAAIAGREAHSALSDNGKRALLHGFTQRISDRAAIGRDTVTGQSASPAEKFAAMKGLADHLAGGGAWELKGDGLRPLDRAALYQAVATVRKVEAAKVEAIYRAKEDSVLRTLLTIPEIAAEYAKATIRPQTEAAKALFAELDEADIGAKGEPPIGEHPADLPTPTKRNKGFFSGGGQAGQ